MSATHIRVTNSNDFDFDDRFDGIYYAFRAGKQMVIPAGAGSLFFGIPLTDDGWLDVADGDTVAPDFAHMQRRWGWNTVERQKDEEMAHAVKRVNDRAKKWSQNIKLEPIIMLMREVKPGNDLLAPRGDDVKTLLAG